MSNKPRLRDATRFDSRAIRGRAVLAERLGASPVRLRESAAVIDHPAAQAVRINEASVAAPIQSLEGTRRYRARLIAGDTQGSTGWYGEGMLREAASNRVFHANLNIFADHPTETEEAERPERSIRDLAGRLVTDAVYESDGLYADIEVYPAFAPLVEAMADTIGMSIRARGTAEYGKPEGERGPLITSIVHAESVDFVTAAGAGGKLVSLLESARLRPDIREAAEQAIGVREATANDIQCALSDAVQAAYGDDGDTTQWIYVCDFDPDQKLVWYTVSDNESRTTWQQSYEMADTSATLGAARTQVVARTEYVPVPPAEQAPDVTDGDGDTDAAVTEADDPKKPYGDVKYADPGYQDDGKKRYPLDSEAHVRSALSYVAQSDNAGKYSAADLKKVKAAIAAAAKKFGIEAAADSKESAAPEPPTDVTDGTPPTAPTHPMEEAVMAESPSGVEPGAAGTTDTAVSTAVTEARTALASVETKLAESNRRNAELEGRLARFDAVEAARPIVAALLSESALTTAAVQALVTKQALVDLPMTEANILDDAKFTVAAKAVITEHEAAFAEAAKGAGEGRVSGLGGNSTSEVTPEQRTANRIAKFKALGMSESAAAIAATGRAGVRV